MKFIAYMLPLAAIMSVCQGHMLRDAWLQSHEIDPDYMHFKAMQHRSIGHRIKQRVMVDDISAKAMNLDEVLIDIQRYLFGFLNATQSLSSNQICVNAAYGLIDQGFRLIDYRFVWLPEYTMKYNLALQKVTDFYNTAFAYCNFNQLIDNLVSIYNPESGSAQGRMFTRILASMISEFWFRMNCIVDGFLGSNFYDIGYCNGKIFTIVFDVHFG